MSWCHHIQRSACQASEKGAFENRALRTGRTFASLSNSVLGRLQGVRQGRSGLCFCFFLMTFSSEGNGFPEVSIKAVF